MTRTMLEAATASTVPTTRWGVNLQRYMRHATSYECMVKDVQRAQRNARAPVPPIPGNANPTAAEGIDFVLRCLQGMGADCDTLKIEAQTLCLLGAYYEDWVLNTSWRRVSLEPRQAANHGSPSIGAATAATTPKRRRDPAVTAVATVNIATQVAGPPAATRAPAKRRRLDSAIPYVMADGSIDTKIFDSCHRISRRATDHWFGLMANMTDGRFF